MDEETVLRAAGILGPFIVWVLLVMLSYLSYRIEFISEKRTYWEAFVIASMLILTEPAVKARYILAGQTIPPEFVSLYSYSLLFGGVLTLVGLYTMRNASISFTRKVCK